MRKLFFSFAVMTLMAGTIANSFGQEPDKKSVKARENLKEAKKDVADSKKDSIEDRNKFKKEAEERIKTHEKSIADFKARILKEKIENTADYNNKLIALEVKNTDMRKKLDDYKEAGKDRWGAFKFNFNREMDELGKAIKDFTTSKKNK